MNFTLFLIEFIESGAFKLGAEQLVKYIEFVEQFRAYYEEFNKLNNENVNYADSPVNPSMGPDAALEVINKANND